MIIKLVLPLAALPTVSNNAAFISQQLIDMWIVRCMVIGGIEKEIASGWTDILYEVSQRQLTSSSAFVISHLESIYNQLAQGKTVDDIKEYLQQLREYYQ